jgi:enoyl-CoA hydratase/carnithine racemase
LPYSDYKCFRFRFDSGVAFVSIDHPPINLLDEVLSQEFDRLGRELETDESVRVVVVQSALPDFFIAHSGLGRVGAASKVVSHTPSFRLTQTIGERFRNMPKATIAGGGDWTGSWWGLYAKIATADGAGTRPGGAAGLQ